jgi:hypothetical protein
MRTKKMIAIIRVMTKHQQQHLTCLAARALASRRLRSGQVAAYVGFHGNGSLPPPILFLDRQYGGRGILFFYDGCHL